MKVTISSARFTRPANTTAYASGDLAANSTTAGSVVPMEFTDAGRGRVARARLSKSGVSVTNAAFRLHLFARGALTFANGDNGVLSVNGAANYLGAMDVTIAQAFTDGATGVLTPISGHGPAIEIPSGTVFGVLEARGAYTPASGEIFTVSLEAEENA